MQALRRGSALFARTAKARKKAKKGRNKDGTFKKGHKLSRTNRNRSAPKRKSKKSKKSHVRLSSGVSRRAKTGHTGRSKKEVKKRSQQRGTTTAPTKRRESDFQHILTDAVEREIAREIKAGTTNPNALETTLGSAAVNYIKSLIT